MAGDVPSIGRSRPIWLVVVWNLCLGLCLTSDLDSGDVESLHGGWETNEKTMIAQPGPCNIEVRDATLTQKEFLHRYGSTEPVVLRKVSDNTEFRKLCRKEQLLKDHGHKTIRLSSANTYSYDKADVSLSYYVENVMKPQALHMLANDTWYWFGKNNLEEWKDFFAKYNAPPYTIPGHTAVYSFGAAKTFYWFGDNNYTEWEELFNSYQEPPYQLPGHTGAYSFGIAGAGTGVPFHFHGPGFGEVIYGRKRWFLYPPHYQPSFHPNRTTLHWLVEDYPRIPEYAMPYECTLEQGDAIFFPDHWWHGTLNIDTSVFISTFLSP